MAVNTSKAEYNRALRRWYAERGICYECGRTWAEPGRSRCKKCYAKDLARMKLRDQDGSKHRAYLKALRAERKAKGLCIDCGTPTDGTHVRCTWCIKKRRESNRMYELRRRVKEGRA